jgi:hypothetical protein
MDLVVTTPEQRTSIYTDVRQMLRPGFLAHPLDVNGSRLVLRSLNDDDWTLLQYRASGVSDIGWQRWAIAASIWMVDGQVVLGDESTLSRLHEMCCVMPRSMLDDVYSVFTGLLKRVTEAARRAEAFLYENESRFMWRSEGSRIVGRDSTGLNAVQKLWLYFNETEDDHEHNQYLWDLAKFQIGPHAPKGVKKIVAQDRQSSQSLRRKRQSVLDRIYYEASGLIPREDRVKKKEKKRAQEFWQAESEEELRDEMRKWVQGIKDRHDLVVDGVKAKIRHDVETRRSAEETRRRALQVALEEAGISKTQLTPLTGEAGRQLLERARARIPGVSRVLDSNKHNSAYDKYIKNNPDVGRLAVDDDGNIVSDLPSEEAMLDILTKPGPDSLPSDLQTRIQSRRPTLADEGEEG